MGYIAQARYGIGKWLEWVRHKNAGWGRWPYHAAMERPYALISSAWAIRILEQLGELVRVTEARRREAVAFLQSTQDPADGHFKDPLVRPADHSGPHSWEDIYGQMSVAADALARLGAAPLHPLPRVRFADLASTDGASYTRGFDWSNPWHHGEAWSRGIRAYYDALPIERRTPLPQVLRDALATYEAEILDPASGTPARRMPEANSSVAMAGLFKTMMAYQHLGVPVPCAAQAVDSTLRLQHPDGEFGCRDNMCINWDALWVLRELDRQLHGNHRHDDIVRAGNRAARLLLSVYRKPDGAFSFHARHCVTNHHSLRLCAEPRPISDMMGTFMVLHCLEYADAWNGGG